MIVMIIWFIDTYYMSEYKVYIQINYNERE